MSPTPEGATEPPPADRDEYSAHELIITATIFIVLELVFALVRLWMKHRQRTGRGLDDWFIWPALVVNIALCIEGLILIPLAGVGTHIEVVKAEDPKKLVAWAKGIFACVWLWALAVALSKLAILGFYLRFFNKPYQCIISYLLMFVLVATFIGTGLAVTFECSPVQYQWDKDIPGGGSCIDIIEFYRWMSFPNVVTDAVMLVLPLPMVWNLHATRNQKVGLVIIFATGGGGILTSCIRFAFPYNRAGFHDPTMTSVRLLGWSIIEPGIYFLAACMPSFRPLFQRFWERAISTSLRSSKEDVPSHHMALALYTIGGGRRDHRHASREYGHSRGMLSRLNGTQPQEDVDEEQLLNRITGGSENSGGRIAHPTPDGDHKLSGTVALEQC